MRSKVAPNLKAKEWLLLAIAASGDPGLSPVQLQGSLFLLGLKRRWHVGPDFYEFEPSVAGPFSRALYADLDAFVASEYVAKEYQPESTRSVLRLAEPGRALTKDLWPQVDPDVSSYLEDAAAWVREQSTLDLVLKAPTIRVIG